MAALNSTTLLATVESGSFHSVLTGSDAGLKTHASVLSLESPISLALCEPQGTITLVPFGAIFPKTFVDTHF
jgi:hypothetical protein